LLYAVLIFSLRRKTQVSHYSQATVMRAVLMKEEKSEKLHQKYLDDAARSETNTANRLVAREDFGNLYKQMATLRTVNGEEQLNPRDLVEAPQLSNMLGLARAWADHSQPEVPANFIPVHRLSFLLHAVIVSDPLFLAGFP
jgi:hypothetical protein